MSDDIRQLLSKLVEEFAVLERLSQRDYESDAGRRIFVRTTFATIEALGFLIRRLTLDLAASAAVQAGSIPFVELSVLADRDTSIDGNGRLRFKSFCHHPLGPYFAFTIRTFADEAKVPGNYICGEGWEAFKRAIKVRNRVTHPKSIADLAISDSDYDTVEVALNWAFNTWRDIVEKSPMIETKEALPPKL